MKKLISLLLTATMVFTALTGCGGDKTAVVSDDATSSAASDTIKPLGGALEEESSEESSSDLSDSSAQKVEYSSVVDGYIQHNGKWVAKIIRYAGFQCMDDEYIFIPEGTTIICDSKFAAFCYRLSDESFVLDANDCESLGMTVNGTSSVNLTSGTFVATKDVLVRFSVKGSLEDIQLYFPKNSSKQYKLYSSEEYIKERHNKLEVYQ